LSDRVSSDLFYDIPTLIVSSERSTAVSRFKALVGVKLASREFENQQVEALVKCRIINRMTELGMSRSEPIPVV